MNEDKDNLEDAIDAEGRNPTQQRMDEAGVEDRPVDVVQPEPAEGGSAGETEVAFEPDVPLVAEVNRGAAESSDRRRKFLAGGAVAASLLVLRRLLRRR